MCIRDRGRRRQLAAQVDRRQELQGETAGERRTRRRRRDDQVLGGGSDERTRAQRAVADCARTDVGRAEEATLSAASERCSWRNSDDSEPRRLAQFTNNRRRQEASSRIRRVRQQHRQRHNVVQEKLAATMYRHVDVHSSRPM